MNNPFDLTGRVAIVTGGNGGIGYGIARGLARAGASIAVVGRNREKSLDAAARLAVDFSVRAEAFTADVSNPEQVGVVTEAIRAAFGRIDILVNNAGINIRKRPDVLTLEEWDEVLRVNLTSAFIFSKAVYPIMKGQGGGKIINIGSMTSIFGAAFAPAYAASKSGIVQLTKSCALAWATDGIQVNAILPGFIRTELTDKAKAEIPEIHEKVQGRTAAGRWGEPDDLAGTAVWMAAPASDFVTGVAVPVDGGYSSAV
ncbi:glucose 1-dehydrogenase [bacterium]|nr:glucose 1-dehydrogenase [bacterium]